MTQQSHDMGYLDYSSNNNRSPSTSRPGYATAGFGAGLSLPRQSQRPFDAPLGSSALYPAERLGGGGYNPRGMDTMAGGMPGYMLDNGQAWNYNTSGVATVNGAVNGPGRQRNVNRRAALPQVRHFNHQPMQLLIYRRTGPITADWACTTAFSHFREG